eukprot:jgi/Tetstr1/429245/TSEL_001908.t1
MPYYGQHTVASRHVRFGGRETIPATPADGLEGDEEEEDPPLSFLAKSPGHAASIDPNEWDRYLTDEKKHATRDEYRHMLCYGVYTAAAHAALTDASRFFDTTAAERSSNGVDGLLKALDDKRLEVSLHHAAKAQAAAQFKGSDSGGSGGGSGGNIRIKDQERAEHAHRATTERADKNKDKYKIKGKPQPGNPARKTTTPQTEEHN